MIVLAGDCICGSLVLRTRDPPLVLSGKVPIEHLLLKFHFLSSFTSEAWMLTLLQRGTVPLQLVVPILLLPIKCIGCVRRFILKCVLQPMIGGHKQCVLHASAAFAKLNGAEHVVPKQLACSSRVSEHPRFHSTFVPSNLGSATSLVRSFRPLMVISPLFLSW